MTTTAAPVLVADAGSSDEPARPRRRALATVALVGSVLLGAAVVLSLVVGAGDIGVDGVLDARLGRTLVAVVVGSAMALAGTVLQGLTRNPVADPGILGLTSGGALLVVLGLHLGPVTSATGYLLAALVGVCLAGVLVHAIASAAPVARQPMTAVLAGAAVMATSTSVMAAVLLSDEATLDVFRHWQVGSVAGRDLGLVARLAPFVLVGALLALGSARTLDALALGDELARGLGQRVRLHRGAAWVGALLLTAAATAMAGPIAFVGLAVPHAVRLVWGPAHSRVLLGSLLLGPVLVLVADTVGRVVAPPGEIQAGIMTAVVGAPVLLVLARRSGRR